MVIFNFLKFGMVKLFETLQTISNMKMNIFQIKIFNEITLLLLIIYSFIKFKVLVSLPKSFHGPLGMRMHCNWPTDHAIDHSSIRLKRLTIQPVFNEVSLFTFSKGTHGFDVMVPKSYLKAYSVFNLYLHTLLLLFTFLMRILLTQDLSCLNNSHMYVHLHAAPSAPSFD